jgi:hypothetical protein
MGDPQYDQTITYIVYSSYQNINSFSDVNNNTYYLYGEGVSGESVTYQCTGTNITPNFNSSSDPDLESMNKLMTTVILGTNCISISENAFEGCDALSYVTIGDSVTSIGEYAFATTGISSVIIGNSVTSIGEYAFSGTNLSTVTIPHSVTSIGNFAFNACAALTSVIIPNSVTSIGTNAFSNTILGTVFIARDNKLRIPVPAKNVLFFGATVTTKLPTTTITLGATYKITSAGVNRKTGVAVTANATYSATASGDSLESAVASLGNHVNTNFIHGNIFDFLLNNKNTKYKIEFGIK